MRVFISYSSKEYDKASSLRQVLVANGINCWMAPQSIPSGGDYSQEIPKAIKACDIFLLLLSEAAQASKWVPKELDNAINQGKIIIPFHADASNLNDAFNFMLSNVQRIEAFNRLSDAYKQLVVYIKSIEGETDFSNVIVSNNNGEKSIENEKSAWGPTSRDTFKWGNPSDYVVFNSMTDNPKIGDERNFVRIRRYSMDTKFSNKVELEVGEEYEVGVWFDNNAKPELNIKENGGAGIAENVRLRIECPEKVTGTHSAVIKGIISSTNSKLKEIWDTAYAYAGSSVLLRYVPNSAIIHSLGTINGEILSSEAMFGKDGVKLGYWKDAWGVVPGGSEYAGYITFRFKVDQPGFKISSLVSIKDKTNYQRSIVAKPGDVLEFQLSYENTGTINQMQIKACDYLPDGLVYIKGSTSWEANYGKNNKASDNLFNGGMNLGDYKPGDWVRVRYQVKVENNKKYFPEGDTVIYNDACIATANGTRRNKVEIIVRR